MGRLSRVRPRPFPLLLTCAVANLLLVTQSTHAQRSVLDKFVDDYVRKSAPTQPEEKKTTQASLKVTVTWNTATDVDLWVTEPGGEKCFYQKTRTRSGGLITPDDTKGFGPETYVITKGPLGEYLIQVNMFAMRGGGATSVTVEIVRDAGTPRQSVQRLSGVLTGNGQTITIARVKF